MCKLSRSMEVDWARLPPTVKEFIAQKSLEDSPKTIAEIMSEIGEDIDAVFDLREMAMNKFASNKHLMNDIFWSCASRELKFVRMSGAFLGFFLGLLQLGDWGTHGWWILPVAGFAIGSVTNCVALRVLFFPIQPISIYGFTLQGLLLRRQGEVAALCAEIVSREVVCWGCACQVEC